MKSDEVQISMLTGSMTRWLALLLLLSSCDARLLLAAEKPKSTTGSTSSYITDLGRRLLRSDLPLHDLRGELGVHVEEVFKHFV